jgi:hypothetical protein
LPIAYTTCESAVRIIRGYQYISSFNIFDIRRMCEDIFVCYNFWEINEFFYRPDVRLEMGVASRFWDLACGDATNLLTADWIVNLQPNMRDLLDGGIKVLAY